MTLTLTVPYPPGTNNLYANYRGRRILSKRGHEYHRSVKRSVVPMKPLTGKLDVQVELYPPDRRKRDIDNIKILLDSLTQAGVWIDDCQVTRLLIWKLDPAPPGKAIVKISEC